DVAVIVATPGDSVVTTPAPDTEAITGLLEAQEVGRPVRTLSFASRVTTVPGVVSPTNRVVAANVTLTVATGGGVTLSVCDPVFPPIVAVIDVEPTARPVTIPLVETV